MFRTTIGGLLGGLILFLIGFIFWATPLAGLAYGQAGEREGAAVQLALGQNLTQSGTGTYLIPNPDTASGTVLFGQGPIAVVHFNTSGFAVDDMNMMIVGLIFALLSGVVMAIGLAAVGAGRSFAAMARLVVCFSIGITIWTILAQPVFNHFGWGHWIYAFVAETTALIVAGLVIARWFLPRESAAPADAPAAEPSEV